MSANPGLDAGSADMSDGILPTRVLRRHDLLVEPINDLPRAEQGGFLRTAYKGLEAGTFRTTLVVVPLGQCSPPRLSEIEHIIVVLEGALEFRVDDVRYRLEALDQIFVPVGVHWEYRNAVLAVSSFISVTGS
jgi:quercetin dioxygenase-like cupin family protein